ncbi:hypothetical protein MMC12_006250 [Toensbergia leucococca]|nr:hypothetical protein [Toensbergia leucococca]
MRNRDEPVPFATYKLSSDVNLGVLIQSFVPQADEKTGITRVELVNGAWRDIGTYTPGLDVCELDLTQMGWPDLNQSAVWLCVYDLLQDEQDRREFADRHGFRTVSDLEAEKREEKLKMEEVDRVREIQLQEDLKRLEELRR